MGNSHTSQRRKHDAFAFLSSSLLTTTRPFAPISSPNAPRDLSNNPEHPKGFGHSFERMAVHRPEPEASAENEAEHVAPVETTTPSPFQLASDTETLAEQDQSVQTTRGTAPLATSSTSALQRVSLSAGDPVPPPPPVNRQANPKHSGWSLERMAITRDHLSPVQRKPLSASRTPVPSPQAEVLQQKPVEPATPKENTTGLPDHLKSGIESLSGLSLDDVHVHYNSSKPAEVDALAYTQGSEIHVGPGQEKHLAHEAWHVVQQKEGRVEPTLQAKGVAINDDKGLEKEADVMGMKASNLTSGHLLSASSVDDKKGKTITTNSIQRMIGFEYQLSNSRVQAAAGTSPLPLTKGAPLAPKQGGVEATVDINQSNDYELEFISDPFNEDDRAGSRDLQRAVNRTSSTVKHLLKVTRGGPRLVSDVLANGIANYTIHVPNTTGRLHITGGIQLDQLHMFLVDYSNRTYKRQINPNEPLVDIAREAVNRANARWRAAEVDQGFQYSDTLREEFVSLVSLLATILTRLRATGGPYFKAYYKLLNRTDMATLVRHVGNERSREIISSNHLDISLTLPTVKTLITESLPPALDLNETLIRYRPESTSDPSWINSGLNTLTRSAWLEQLYRGNDPLSVAWQQTQVSATPPVNGAQDAVDTLESVGAYGSQTDASSTSIRPIFEIRDIPMVNLEFFERWFISLSEYIKAVNAGEGRPFEAPADPAESGSRLSNLMSRIRS